MQGWNGDGMGEIVQWPAPPSRPRASGSVGLLQRKVYPAAEARATLLQILRYSDSWTIIASLALFWMDEICPPQSLPIQQSSQ